MMEEWYGGYRLKDKGKRIKDKQEAGVTHLKEKESLWGQACDIWNVLLRCNEFWLGLFF